jgi:hypothetical protein
LSSVVGVARVDEVEARLSAGTQLLVLFRRQIDHDQAVDAGGLGILEKRGDAVE